MSLLRFPGTAGRRDAGAPVAGDADVGRLVRIALDGEVPSGDHPGEYVFASYLEGSLAEGAEEAFERHVASCDACTDELVLARRTGVGVAPAGRTWAWRIAASLAIVLGGLVAALLAARAISGRIETRMAGALREALGGKANVQDVALALRGGPGVDVTGLSVADPTGGPAMVTVPSARWTVDLASLARGEITGSLVLRDPTIHIVRDPDGRLNVDGVLPTSRSSDDLFSRARRKAIDRVEVANGTVSLVDRSTGDPREVRMAAVDARLDGLASQRPTHVVASGGLESTRRNASFEGDVGPWGAGQKPAYRFSRVALDGVALRNLPVGRTVRGGLSFDGALSGAGDSWAEIAGGARGRGDLQVVSGSIAGRNVVRDVLVPLLGTEGTAAAPAGLATLLAAGDTSFDRIAAPVEVAGARLSSPAVEARAGDFGATGRLAVASGGDVRFQGEMRIAPGAAREIVALLPGGASLVDADGSLTLPFSVQGTWPDVRVTVDAERFAARTILRRGIARLFAVLAPLG
jgi:hypothetical protein